MQLSKALSRFIFLLSFAFIISCTKEKVESPSSSIVNVSESTTGRATAVKRPFKMNSNTWYRISPVDPFSWGPNQVAFANVPGGGSGNATHMGNVKTWFNQLAYSYDGLNPPTGSVTAPLVDALLYGAPFPGAPLPFIQPGDFSPLIAADAWLQLPVEVNGNLVNGVVYNPAQEAVFLCHTAPSVMTQVSASRMNFTGSGIFCGGKGKFESATGTYTFSGHFNPNNPNDASYSVDGWIWY